MWNHGKVLIIVTGASRGLGQAISIQLCQICDKPPTVILLGRTLKDLETTQKLCKEVKLGVNVQIHKFDLATSEKCHFESLFKEVNFQNFDSLVLVHNAGSLGNQGTKIADFDDIQEMQNYYRLNVFSVMLLNSIVSKKVSGLRNMRKLIINISSLAALQPFETWGSYCSGKAARDSLFKVMAVEEPSWMILNYAPGPLNTKMIDDLLANRNTHSNIRNAFEDMKEKNQLLDPMESARRLVEILSKPFKSGDHIDYFDQL